MNNKKKSAKGTKRPLAAKRKKSEGRVLSKKDAPSAVLPAAGLRQSLVQPKVKRGLTIVGLGASAGGLEALELFFDHVPPASGMAFVIVQHLDPSHASLMVELLQRHTQMKVMEVADRTRVRADHVYVIPPDKDMSILHGVLHLLEPVPRHGLRLPIDFFFRSLAADQKERGVGVILSGMGSDGSLGLKAIKAAAGLVLVQEPASAKFEGMPRSAIESGAADIVARVEDLPARLTSVHGYRVMVSQPAEETEEKKQGALEKIAILLREQTGHDFSRYKKSTIFRRVERRMGLHQIESLAAYVRYLQESPQEADLLFKELLIGVTSFFRDPAAWDQLRDVGLPSLLKEGFARKALRAWVAGCSSGEEAYSLAIIFKELVEKGAPGRLPTLQIFATDLDRAAIEKARQGVYPDNIVADVSPERLERFFVKEEAGYRIKKEIREMVVFSQQNLTMDPPFTKLDLLCCRNLLIYLELGLQKKLMPLFNYCLQPGGLLFLGSSETVGSFENLFTLLDGKARLFRRALPASSVGPIDFPSDFVPGKPLLMDAVSNARAGASLQSLAEQVLLQEYAPAAVLTNESGDIVFINGRTGKYLEPAAGKANWNVFAMAREGLRYDLVGGFQRAVRQKAPVLLSGVKLGLGVNVSFVNVTLQRIDEPEALKGLVLMVFVDQPAPELAALGKRRLRSESGSAQSLEFERKLKLSHLELQAAHEQMQMSQEELRSVIEELQSTNEELQSTNEELTTSKEELQSLNEELQTVNAELNAKVEELSRVNNDMQNLLNSTDIATVFLDNALNVRRFTTQASKLIKLIAGDVGRPLTDLSTSLVYPSLAADVREVLRSLVFVEKRIVSRDGRNFVVRIMPYRTLDNRIDGVVITFLDISSHGPLVVDTPVKSL